MLLKPQNVLGFFQLCYSTRYDECLYNIKKQLDFVDIYKYGVFNAKRVEQCLRTRKYLLSAGQVR